MDTRLEIASRVLAWMVHEHNSPDVAARESLYFADALLAAHEATAPKAEALPEDAPVMEWEVRVVGSGGGYVARARPTESNETMKAWHLMHDAAVADLPAFRAAATAYSAAKGCRAVFVEEGCKDA